MSIANGLKYFIRYANGRIGYGQVPIAVSFRTNRSISAVKISFYMEGQGQLSDPTSSGTSVGQ